MPNERSGTSTPLLEAVEARLPALRRRLAETAVAPALEEVGVVERVGDGIAILSGLHGARLGECLTFADGSRGLVMELDRDRVGCILLSATPALAAGTRASGTGAVMRVPVGEALLGRVVDPTGAPLDGGPPVKATRHDPVERPAPGIVERELVTEPLMTGIVAIDAMIPIGRGQRELLFGDKKTGKTSVAVDAVINQRDTDVVCVYAMIGQKSSTVVQTIDAVKRYGKFDNTIFVVGEADDPAGSQWLAPYSACTMAEYFRDRGGHALLVVDDLTKHAGIYRQLSLLLRRPLGREAFPGDIFYIHSRFLERGAKLNAENGGGSLTILPIAETEAGNVSAFIPTNLISITDGQVYFEPELFYEGQKPAINIPLSVSRVGGKTQVSAMKSLSERLRLEYAQFLELEVFTKFGTLIDERTKATIGHGQAIRAILTQPRFAPLSLAVQVALLLGLSEGLFDHLDQARVQKAAGELGSVLSARAERIMSLIDARGELGEVDRATLLAEITTYVAGLKAKDEANGATDQSHQGTAQEP